MLSHIKLANVSTLSLINLAGISETWEAFFITFFLFIPWKDWMIDINSFSPHKWYCFQLFVLVFLTHCTKKIPVKKFFNKWANPKTEAVVRGILRKKCSQSMRQIYKRTPMPKCDFNKVAKQLRKGVLRNFAKFTENTCARVSFLIKLQA